MSEQEQMNSMELPTLEQLEAVEAEALIDLEPDESRKEPVKYYVVSTIQYVANSRKELREYMNNFDPEYTMIIRGNETVMKKRTVYSF
ncbi:MAG: hypothetical protein KJ630_05225 [Proteobacteria bacterium]|nr:hypothetical protein [Pseudomonadota bacterium]